MLRPARLARAAFRPPIALSRPPRLPQWTSFTRLNSTSSASIRYPYPSTPHPTPFQIFHLSPGVKQEEIKNYELVRIHHPDAPASRSLAPELAQTRFHSITHAYDVLRGGKPGSSSYGGPPGESAAERAKREAQALNAAIWRAKQAKRADLDFGGADDRWKDRLLIGLVLVSLAGFVAYNFFVRSKAMAKNIEYTKTLKAERAARRGQDDESHTASRDAGLTSSRS